jgi:hypothetical protein
MKKPRFRRRIGAFGAGDGTRTRDNLLGRQTLYQTELLPQEYPTTVVIIWPGRPPVKRSQAAEPRPLASQRWG